MKNTNRKIRGQQFPGIGQNRPANAKIMIYGGTQQINTAATTAIQNVYGDACPDVAMKEKSEEEEMSDAETGLKAYVHDQEILREITLKMGRCTCARDFARIVVDLMLPIGISERTMVTASFIETLLPFANGFEVGKGIDNFRCHINKELVAYKRQQTLMKKAQGIQS